MPDEVIPTADQVETYSILVPLADREQATSLLRLACALAHQRGGQVIALAVTPDGAVPGWLDEAARTIGHPNVPIKTWGRAGRDIGRAILDAIDESQADLLLLGLQEKPEASRPLLGHIMDRVANEAPCDMALVRTGRPGPLQSILVPTSGGPNAALALELARSLSQATGGTLTALYIIPETVSPERRRLAEKRSQEAASALCDLGADTFKVVEARSIAQGILEEAEEHDLVLIGGTQESFLDRVLFGDVPERVVRHSPKPVTVVFRSRGMAEFWLRRLWWDFFNLWPTLDLDERAEVYQAMRDGAQPDIDYFVMTALATIIATLGLLLNSAAVIIGAMLVAPLMSPIMALGLSIVQGDGRLLRLALTTTIKGIALAVSLAFILGLLSPLGGPNTEILARTQPNLLDLLVALASGAAGAYAVSRKDVAAALPGVAIAAALVPPLATVGISLADGMVSAARGAALLFTTNLLVISLAATLVFLLLGFRPAPTPKRRRFLRQGFLVSLALVILISLPLAEVMIRSLRSDRQQQTVEQIVQQRISAEGLLLVGVEYAEHKESLEIAVTVRSPHASDEKLAQDLRLEIGEAVGKPVHLLLITIPVSAVEVH
jgi:uncharacterized hydrophobic protein (TIGR00271 family)